MVYNDLLLGAQYDSYFGCFPSSEVSVKVGKDGEWGPGMIAAPGHPQLQFLREGSAENVRPIWRLLRNLQQGQVHLSFVC